MPTREMPIEPKMMSTHQSERPRSEFKFYLTTIFLTLWIILSEGFSSAALGVTHSADADQMTAALPESLVQIAPDDHAILVEKSTQTLSVYGLVNKTPVLKFQARCSTGEVAGPKFEAGDKKTPIGVYFITDAYEDRYLTPIYGKKAFPLDYPNFLDRKMGKNGSAIWLHGTNKALRPMDSNGCVALENNNILALSEFVSLNLTPVIVDEQIKTAPPSELKENQEGITAVIGQWLSAHTQGTYHDYLSFYDAAYLPDISWWTAWDNTRKDLQAKDTQIRVMADRIGIYKQGGTWVCLFDYCVESRGDRQEMGQKKLFLERLPSKKYTIVGDVFQTHAQGVQKNPHPLVGAVSRLGLFLETDDYFIEFVQRWLAAWSAKDMETYASFYDASFVSEGMGKTRWVNRKKNLSKRYKYIKLKAKDFKISKSAEKCTVHFYQEYKSSGFSTEGTKTLVLHKKGETWKIFQESWKEK
ncbi:MAG: DUF4440 domain-containing protein [Desulfobacteraceae bacterium]|nr:MAG: DUF4440 domain-containing protein [Desulfobacteraceae bacterium]